MRARGCWLNALVPRRPSNAQGSEMVPGQWPLGYPVPVNHVKLPWTRPVWLSLLPLLSSCRGASGILCHHALPCPSLPCLVVCAFPGHFMRDLVYYLSPLFVLAFLLAPTWKLCPIQGLVTGWESWGHNPQSHLTQIHQSWWHRTYFLCGGQRRRNEGCVWQGGGWGSGLNRWGFGVSSRLPNSPDARRNFLSIQIMINT